MSTAEHFRSEEAIVTLMLTDVNDNTPIFDVSQYQFSVNDIQQIGASVGKVSNSSNLNNETCPCYGKNIKCRKQISQIHSLSLSLSLSLEYNISM